MDAIPCLFNTLARYQSILAHLLHFWTHGKEFGQYLAHYRRCRATRSHDFSFSNCVVRPGLNSDQQLGRGISKLEHRNMDM